MKTRVSVWTLSWNTATGTDCKVFGSEVEWFNFFREIIEADIDGIDSSEADQIRDALRDGEIPYDRWQERFKDDSDTYNWGEQEVEIELSTPALAL